ncbi:MAG: RecX family transcriptional regulator [Acidobacteria bacterium]|nr:RecX family transcriptional regulator [Acidobacteriota bacterium]
MQRKKLPPEVVENALDEAYTERDEEGLIDRAVDKRVRLKGKPSTREETKKLFDYLMRRGFSYDLVLRKVRQLSKEAETEGNS